MKLTKDSLGKTYSDTHGDRIRVVAICSHSGSVKGFSNVGGDRFYDSEGRALFSDNQMDDLRSEYIEPRSKNEVGIQLIAYIEEHLMRITDDFDLHNMCEHLVKEAKEVFEDDI